MLDQAAFHLRRPIKSGLIAWPHQRLPRRKTTTLPGVRSTSDLHGLGAGGEITAACLLAGSGSSPVM
jgi:hypothetical protein